MNTKICLRRPKFGVRDEVPLSLSTPKPFKAFTTLQPQRRPLPPPSPGVRALCAAFLVAPIILGALLLIQSLHFDTLWTRFDTLRHNKKDFQQNPASLLTSQQPPLN
jgi:hypothetical protein